MTNLTIGPDTFRVEVAGDATRPALMLANSLGTDLTMWDGQMPGLTEQFRVIRYDPRGHGESRGREGPISIADLGRDALAILDALEIEQVHWIGLSMGGAIGLWILANAPERIGRAVLANTAPKFGTPDTWNARIASVRAGGMENNAKATMERWFSPGFAAREPEQVAKIHDLLRNTSPEGYAACCAALRDMDLREALHTIDHELLVITGTDDPVVPKADAEAFIAALTGARRIALTARHLSNVEAEADFNAAVIAFLTAKTASKMRSRSTPRAPEPTKVAATKRSGAARRSNAARAPLKAPARRSPPKKSAGAKKKPAAGHRRPGTKKSVARRQATKTTTKKRVMKTARKAATTRRPAPAKATAARRPAKAPTRKTKAAKAATKTTRKTARKAAAKKLPTGRRRTTTKPRRPTGRRTR